MNLDYTVLAQIAYRTVTRTMQEGETTHGVDNWKKQSISEHKRHALEHAENAYTGKTDREDIDHCLTRCAIIEYLKGEQDANKRTD